MVAAHTEAAREQTASTGLPSTQNTTLHTALPAGLAHLDPPRPGLTRSKPLCPADQPKGLMGNLCKEPYVRQPGLVRSQKISSQLLLLHPTTNPRAPPTAVHPLRTDRDRQTGGVFSQQQAAPQLSLPTQSLETGAVCLCEDIRRTETPLSVHPKLHVDLLQDS